MKYETNDERELIKAKHIAKLNDIFEKDFDELSNNELAFLKCVSLSSIMTMKKAGYSNDEIMLHDQQNKAKATKTTIMKHMNAMSDEELEALGFKRL